MLPRADIRMVPLALQNYTQGALLGGVWGWSRATGPHRDARRAQRPESDDRDAVLPQPGAGQQRQTCEISEIIAIRAEDARGSDDLLTNDHFVVHPGASQIISGETVSREFAM